MRMADRYAALLPSGHARDRRRRVGDQRRRGARARGARRGDALPADPGGSDRVRRGALARGSCGRDRQGRCRDRALGAARTVLLDKTGTLTLGMPGGRARRCARRRRARRAAATGRVGRPALQPRARARDRATGGQRGPGAGAPGCRRASPPARESRGSSTDDASSSAAAPGSPSDGVELAPAQALPADARRNARSC